MAPPHRRKPRGCGPLAPVLAAIALAACRPSAGEAEAPGTAQSERGRDAAQLPAFEVGEEPATPNARGVPYERFYVTLDDAPVRGPADAPVTIVMFSDFECPYCERAHETMKLLTSEYPRDVRIAYKAYPLDFHSNALVAAMAARSAQQQGKFWEFHDLLYSQRGIEQSQLEAYARRVDMDVKALRRDLESLEYAPPVRRDMRQARKLGVRSTPTFFINGRELKGAKPVAIFREIVEEEIALAKKWRADDVPADRIYEHAIADGYRKVQYTQRRGLDPDQVFPVPIGDSPQRGPQTAPVTIVEFGDFECPFCARGNATVEELLQRYKGKIRMVYKHNPLPFHSHAFLAARASMAAHDQGKFWAYHDALYEQRAEFDEDDLFRLARKLKLDQREFRKAMESTRHDARIVQDQQLALLLGATGTPAYFVNGRPIEGAMPLLQFRLLVEEELDRAERALARGVEPSALYETLINEPLE